MTSASFSACPRAAGQSCPSPSPSPGRSGLPPLLPAPTSAASSPGLTPQPKQIAEPREQFIHRSQVDAFNDNALRPYSVGSRNEYEHSYPRLPQPNDPRTTNSGFSATLQPPPPPPPPPPSLPFPSILPSPQALSQTTQLPPMSLPPQNTQGAARPAQPIPSHSPSGSRKRGLSPERGRTLLPSGRRNSNSEAIPTWPPASQSHKSNQAGIQFIADGDGCQSGNIMTKPPSLKEDACTNSSKLAWAPKPAGRSPPGPLTLTSTVSMTTAAAATPIKSRRVRTGCLTCRERHLKCDEGAPDCLNCRKGNRACKRGLKLNFIDIQLKPIPCIPAVVNWDVSFLDESRLIASEYAGGLARYPRVKDNAKAVSRDAATAAYQAKYQQLMGHGKPNQSSKHTGARAALRPPSTPLYEAVQAPFTKALPDAWSQPPDLHSSFFSSGQSRELDHARPPAKEPCGLHATRDELKDKQCDSPSSETSSIASSMVPQGMGPSSVASFQADVGNSPTSVDPDNALRHDGGGNSGLLNTTLPEGLPTPPSEKIGLRRGGRAAAGLGAVGGFDDISSSSRGSSDGERDYLNSPDEVLYMQVFVQDVGVWMDSLDKDKHFSRIIPYLALKSPMMLNAFLACGVKHLALVNEAYQDEKALYYYDTATTQLLRSLQNPDRDIVECAITAVVLNVYEIMSEKPSGRMNHIAGARALILECGWNARSQGIGAACFWLNIGMEVLSCLAFNWQTAWEPDQWGLDIGFTNTTDDSMDEDVGHELESSGNRADGAKTRVLGRDGNLRRQLDSARPTYREPLTAALDSIAALTGGGDEETWVHRIFYIVAKIANFRAGVLRFPEPSPHDEQARLEHRFSEWKRLKGLCDMWNRNCPRSMRPFSYLFPSQSASPGSVFPNIWLIKQTAVIGRLFYHTAMVLLHQVNPTEPKDSTENLDAQRHHAHQVCGIVAHTKDRGVTNVAVRSLAISALVLTDAREQNEVLHLFKRITEETGWRTDSIYGEIRQVWARGMKDMAANMAVASIAAAPSPSGILPPPSDLHPAGVLSSSFGLVPNPAPGPALPMPPSSHRGFVSFASPSPSATQLPHPGPSGAASLGRAQHFRMYSTASIVSNSTLTGATTAGSSPHSPLVSVTVPYRPPMVNPLMHADFNLPGHPYKAFYRRPNDSAQCSSQSI